MTPPATRRSQADRRAASRAALLEATARGLARASHATLRLEEVAAQAGYTRGALYHQFPDKDALVLATVGWVRETWEAEVGCVFAEGRPPVEAITELARRHAVFCRRDIAGVMLVLRIEFRSREHPVGAAVRALADDIVVRVRDLVRAGRRDGSIPAGPPAGVLAEALLAAVEASSTALAGRPSDDEEVARRLARGILGLSAAP